MKVVINNKYGGFSLSHKAVMRYAELKEIKLYPNIDDITKRINKKNWYFSDGDIKRNDPTLIKVIDEMGEESYGSHAKLKIIEIPDDIEWTIKEYDGLEWVAEKHRSWGRE